MKRWVRRASKAEEMVLKLEEKNESLQEQYQNQDVIIANLDEHVDHLLSIEQPYHQKKKIQKEKQNVGLLKLCAIMYKQMMPRIMLHD
jgi:dephospho-CoA kinase